MDVPEYVVGHADGGKGGGGGGGDDLERKEMFTVCVKCERPWTTVRLLSEKMEDFVADLQQKARLLKLIDHDEHIGRLMLASSDGEVNPRELDGASTLGDVRICMRVRDVLVAVLVKPPPPSPVTSAVLGHPNTTLPAHEDDPASSNAKCFTLLEPQLVAISPQKGSSSLWASMAPSSFVSPLWSDGVGGLLPGNSQPDHRSAMINAYQPSGVQNFTELELKPYAHLTEKEKASSLVIPMTELKSASKGVGDVGLGRCPGRLERASSQHLLEGLVDRGHTIVTEPLSHLQQVKFAIDKALGILAGIQRLKSRRWRKAMLIMPQK